MGVPLKGQIIAVMVMYQETSLRNLANDGTSPHQSWPSPGRDYWLGVTRLSLKYPHDKFGSLDGAHDTDSIGLYQQRPAYAWGNYGNSTGTTDPEGVVQRLLDPRWSAMAFFGGSRSAAPKGGLLDVAGWQTMAPTVAADAVQRSNHPDYYAQWEGPATTYVNNNQDAPAIALPWYPGGGTGALACTSIPTNPSLGEAGHNPFGNLDSADIEGAGIRVSGWALDPDAINGTTLVHFYDQAPSGTVAYVTGLANQSRPDVNQALNVFGRFGYSSLLPWNGPGLHTICAYAINVGRGTDNPRLSCRFVVVPGPIGNLDGAAQGVGQTIDVSGWAADPAAPGRREEVHIYVTGPNGTFGTPGTFTGDARPDVSAAISWAGGSAGYHANVPSAGIGDNRVCVYAININPPYSNPLLACRIVSVRQRAPIGNYESLAVSGSTATITGWAIDPNQPGTSLQMHVYVNGAGAIIDANQARPDVNTVLGVPGRHGFSASVGIPSGTSSVCVYAIGVTTYNNTLLGCRSAAPAPLARAFAAPNPQAETLARPPADTSQQRPSVAAEEVAPPTSAVSTSTIGPLTKAELPASTPVPTTTAGTTLTPTAPEPHPPVTSNSAPTDGP
jgi:hypothetical protein